MTEARDHADRLLRDAVAALDAAYGPDESPVSRHWAADRGDCRVHYADEAEARQNAGGHPVVRGGIVTLPWETVTASAVADAPVSIADAASRRRTGKLRAQQGHFRPTASTSAASSTKPASPPKPNGPQQKDGRGSGSAPGMGAPPASASSTCASGRL